MNRKIAAGVLTLSGLLALGCNPPKPKYSLYTSPDRDFQCSVPWAWNVIYDSEGKRFTNLTFIGPFERDFYLGAPSFSVRWFTRYAPHRLGIDTVEMYSDAEDFIKQNLEAVYGADREMFKPEQDIQLKAIGRTGKYFVVVSPGPAHPKAQWGTAVDEGTGKSINPRKHAYVLIPMPSGFYVLTYPATTFGYKKYKDQFDELVFSFVPLKDGPGGAPLPPPADDKPQAKKKALLVTP